MWVSNLLLIISRPKREEREREKYNLKEYFNSHLYHSSSPLSRGSTSQLIWTSLTNAMNNNYWWGLDLFWLTIRFGLG